MTRTFAYAVVMSSLAALVACEKKESAETAAAPSATHAAAPAPSAAPPRPVATPAPTPTPAPPPTANPQDVAAVKSCCTALHGEAAKKTPKQADWELAAKACDGVEAVVAKGATTRASALTQIKASAARAGALPSACQ